MITKSNKKRIEKQIRDVRRLIQYAIKDLWQFVDDMEYAKEHGDDFGLDWARWHWDKCYIYIVYHRKLLNECYLKLHARYINPCRRKTF